ncbi:MAG: hypothetical protein JWR19_2887 [Pedosphaera sp.]|nr:hypothetical protein [Pedosphaera sp.]
MEICDHSSPSAGYNQLISLHAPQRTRKRSLTLLMGGIEGSDFVIHPIGAIEYMDMNAITSVRNRRAG